MPSNVELFIKEHKNKLLHEKLRLENLARSINQLKVPKSPQTNENHVNKTDDVDINSKVENINFKKYQQFPNLYLCDEVKKTPNINLVDKLYFNVTKSEENPRPIFSIGTEYKNREQIHNNIKSNLITKVTAMPSKSATDDNLGLAGLGSQYEKKKRELLRARQLEYQEYLEKQKLLEQLAKQKRHPNLPSKNVLLEEVQPLKDIRQTTNEKELSSQPEHDIKTDFEIISNDKISRAIQTEPLLVTNLPPIFVKKDEELVPLPHPTSLFGANAFTESNNVQLSSFTELPALNNNIQLSSFTELPALNNNSDLNGAPHSNRTTPIQNPEASPRVRLAGELRSNVFADYFENPEQREERQALEEAHKREIYQLELKKQIEQKQRDIEAIREKEIEEEKALARRLEQQIRAMQLDRDREIQAQQDRIDRVRTNTEMFIETKKQMDLEIESENLRKGRRTHRAKHEEEHFKDVLVSRLDETRPVPTQRYIKNPPLSINIDDQSLFTNSNKPGYEKLADQIEELKKPAWIADSFSENNNMLENSSQPLSSARSEKDLYAEDISSTRKFVKVCNSNENIELDENIYNNEAYHHHPNRRVARSPPVPAILKHRRAAPPSEQPYSMNIDKNSKFADIRDCNVNTEKLHEQIVNIEKDKPKNIKKAVDSKIISSMDSWKNLDVEDYSHDIRPGDPYKHHHKQDTERVEGDQKCQPEWEIQTTVEHSADDYIQPQKMNNNYKDNKEGNETQIKTTSILTQLGAIRKQLQLEQMKMDKTIANYSSLRRT